MNIVFLDKATVPVDFRAPAFAHQWVNFDKTAREQVIERAGNAEIILTNKVKLGPELLAQLPRLRLVALTATGYDNIDVGYCRTKGICVCNVPGYANTSVPEHVLLLMLALRRNLPGYQAAIRDERWQKSEIPNLLDFPVQDLSGQILGLVGYGALAKGVEVLAKAFGMTVLIAERKGANSVRPGRVSFDEVLKRADIISLHAMLNTETKKLIGPREIALMKPTSLLINTARGGLLDEAAAAEAVQSGRLGGVGVDVLSEEPPRNGNPLLSLELPNVIVTPHVAWTSRQALEVLAEAVIENLEAFVSGHPQNQVMI